MSVSVSHRRRQRKQPPPLPPERPTGYPIIESRSSEAARNRQITSGVNAPAGPLTSYICYMSCKPVYASTAGVAAADRADPSPINTITTADPDSSIEYRATA